MSDHQHGRSVVERSPLSGPRTDSEKFLETVAQMRCPCGHLSERHKKGDPDFPVGVEVMGACRDCDCQGLIEFPDDEGDD